jgi:hypothetical protein
MNFQFVTFLSPHLAVIAYLDPGSGSLILQLLIAGLMGAGILVKVFWKKIKGLFSRSSVKKEDDTELQP